MDIIKGNFLNRDEVKAHYKYFLFVFGLLMVMISYHSLEDRLVKRFLKNGMFEGEPPRDIYGNYKKTFESLKTKAIIPDDKEIEENSRARSAKMRIGTKI